MSSKERWTRSLIIKRLATRGLTLRRVTYSGIRIWIVSDGIKYETLAQIAKVYPPLYKDEVHHE